MIESYSFWLGVAIALLAIIFPRRVTAFCAVIIAAILLVEVGMI